MTGRKPRARYRTLVLDAKTISSLVSIKDAMHAVEKAFRLYGEGKAVMPPKIYLHLDEYKGDFRAMPAYIEGFDTCCIKWVNVHPGNKSKGLPTVMAVIILSDPENGFPLSVMDATYVTSLRTGAAGGVAAKYLARKKSHSVGLVGCGVQAETQLLALNEVFELKKIEVWGAGKDEAGIFAGKMKKKTGLNINPADTIKKCVEDKDIIVTTTPSRKPLVRSEWIKEGAHVNAIGADARGKQELEAALLKKAKIVVDAFEQASHSGEINVPLREGRLRKKDIYANIGEIVAGRKRGRTSDKEITVFDSTGLAIQDAAIADIIFKKAGRRGKGRYIDLVNVCSGTGYMIKSRKIS